MAALWHIVRANVLRPRVQPYAPGVRAPAAQPGARELREARGGEGVTG